MRAALMAASLLWSTLVAPAFAQSGDDSLIRIQPRDTGGVMLTAVFGLVQWDTTAPEQTTGFPRLVVRAMVGERNGAPVLGEGVDVLFGFFSAPPDTLRPAFAFQVGDAPPVILAARWNCVPGTAGKYLYGVFSRVPIRTIRSMTDSAPVSVYAGGVRYGLFSHGKRILRALVAHLPADSATPAMLPADTSLRVYHDFEVENRAHQKSVDLKSITAIPHPKGEVVLGFIVDTTGRPQRGSMHVIRATDSATARAIRKAVYDWTYEPAFVCGHPVPQFTELSFKF